MTNRPSSKEYSHIRLSVYEDQDPVEINDKRVFYHAKGHFRHTWDAVNVNLNSFTVEVTWANGLVVELRGSDAEKFLTITRSRFSQKFREHLERL